MYFVAKPTKEIAMMMKPPKGKPIKGKPPVKGGKGAVMPMKGKKC